MAVVNVELSALLPFDPRGDVTSIGPLWKKWRKAFGYFIVGKGIVNDDQKKPCFFTVLAWTYRKCSTRCQSRRRRTLTGMTKPRPPSTRQPCGNWTATSYPTSENEPFERHVFRGLCQEEGETVDQFPTQLRRQSENCGWDNPDEAIRDQVIDKCRSVLLRQKLIERGTDLTLSRVQDIARTLEAVEIQEKKVGGDQHGSSGVNRIGGKKQTRYKTPQKKGRCFCCDQERHYSTDKNCPSRYEACNNVNVLDILLSCARPETREALRINSVAETPSQGEDSNLNTRAEYRLLAKMRAFAFTVRDADKGAMENQCSSSLSSTQDAY